MQLSLFPSTDEIMEKLIEELKRIMPFKETTTIGDVVLIAAKEPQFVVYGLVTSIERDESKRDEWWHVNLTLLTIPLQQTVWTLRTAQMNGDEIFTMGGEQRFFKAIDVGTTSAGFGRRLSPVVEKAKDGLKRIK